MAVDPALAEQLRSRGKFDTLNKLESADRGTGFISTAKEAVKQFFDPRREAQEKVIAPVAKFIAPLGASLGAALSAGRAKELQEQATKQQISLADKVMAKLRDPNLPQSSKQRIFESFQKTSPDIIAQVPELQETAAQTIGKAVVTATAALPLAGRLLPIGRAAKPAAKIISAQERIAALGRGQTIAKGVTLEPSIGPKLAGKVLRVGKSALTGAGFGAAIGLEEGKRGKQLIRPAAEIAGISVFAPPIIGRAFKFASKNIGKIAKGANTFIESSIPKLHNVAKQSTKKTGNFLVDSASQNRASLKSSLAAVGAKVAERFTRPLDPFLIDRLQPIRVFDKFVEDVTKQKIDMTPNSSYIKARNFAGIEGKFTVASNDFDDIFERGEFKDIKDDVYGYVKGLDLLNRAERGQAVEGAKSIVQIRQALKGIEERVNPARLESAVGQYNDFTRSRILNEFVDSGLLKKEQADNMIRTNPNWTPHDVLDFFEEVGSNAFKGGGTFNVLDNAVKAAKGSEREIAPVRIATLHRLQQAQNLAERNRVMRSVFEKVENDPVSFGFIKFPTPEVGKKAPDIRKAGFEKVSYFNNGTREEWLVPSDLGRALKNLDGYQLGPIMKWMAIPARILRAGATRLNVAFSLSNFPRDLQTAAGISKNGFTRRQLADALNEVADLNNPQTREFFERGGAFGGLIGAEIPSRDILAASKRAPILEVGSKIGKVVESVGERFENATRFAVYKNAIASGMPKELAVFEARNATVDFAKQGTLIGAINQVVPFLNARTQGLVNTLSALSQDPTKFVRRQLFQAVYPAMYLYAHNNQYESFQNIPKEERDRNWIIQYGETDGFDNAGAPIKVPEYIKIRKGEVQQAAANTVENYLDLSNREDPRGLKEFLGSQVLNVSPVSQSSLGPLSAPFELVANYDLFTTRPIEPEFQEVVPEGKKFPREQVPSELRAQRWNGATARHLSKIGLDKIGLSPARIEFIIGKLFATTGKDILSVVDMTQTGLDKTGIPEGKATTAQKLSRTPIFRTFIGSNAAAEKIMIYETLEKVSKEQFEQIELPRELEAMSILDIAGEINEKQGREEANKYIDDLDLTKDMKKRIRRIKENREIGETNFVQIYNKVQGNSIRLRLLVDWLNQIETKEQKNNLIRDVNPSKDIMKRLRQAKKEGLLKDPINE